MKNLSTGTGLALLAGAIVSFPLINRLSSIDQAAHAAPPMEAVKAISAASIAQATPTIVWYGVAAYGYWGSGMPVQDWTVVGRAWSNGRVEIRRMKHNYNACSSVPQCQEPWITISDPNDGYNAASDINFDSKVDGNDLGQLLAAWGDAPRQDITPSDCPLNLINP
jgi:hypothetical protein